MTARILPRYFVKFALLRGSAASAGVRYAESRKTPNYYARPAAGAPPNSRRCSLPSACGARLVAGRVRRAQIMGRGGVPCPCGSRRGGVSASAPSGVLGAKLRARPCRALRGSLRSVVSRPGGGTYSEAAAGRRLSRRFRNGFTFHCSFFSPRSWLSSLRRPPIIAHRLHPVKGTPKFFRSSATLPPEKFLKPPP